MPVGKFIHIDPKGTYLEPRDQLAAGPATELSFVEYGISPGDYLSLRCVGSFSAGWQYPNEHGLAACFFAFGVGGPVAPGNYGQESPDVTPPTWPVGTVTDISEDFSVPQEQAVIVRVPAGATRLLFSVPDAYFGDNSDDDGDFGVLLTFPNRPHPVPGAADGREDGTPSARGVRPGQESDDDRWLCANLPLLGKTVTDWPVATTFASSPFAVDASAATTAQYRGWYGTWNPQRSHFNRDPAAGRKHMGIDVFAPRGTKLIVPVGPARVYWLPDPRPTSYGNVVAFRFVWQGQKYTAIYGHCDGFLLADGAIVQAGELTATAGCSGNAGQYHCGLDLPSGGRNDHVHFAVFKDETIADSASPIDPAELFAWQPVTPT